VSARFRNRPGHDDDGAMPRPPGAVSRLVIISGVVV
jgi:hypothetical protein